MKKLFGKSFLALVLAMTMLMGMSMTVMADEGKPDDAPETISCDAGHLIHVIIVGESKDEFQNDVYNVWYYVDNEFSSTSTIMKTTTLEKNKWYYQRGMELVKCPNLNSSAPAPAAPSHTHNYEWNTLSDPTTETDGVEAYICSCGDIQATQPISAAHYVLKLNADAVKNAKADATVVVELGRWNSLPRWFVAKLVERDDLNVTLKITYNHQNNTLDIPKTATIEDESIEWYGPLKLLSMFPQK